jgi:hypothetical protein
VTTFAALPIEHAVTSTVAIGCEHKSSVERTRLNPKGCIQEKVSVKKSLWQLKYREKMGEVKCKVRKNMVASVCKVG